MSNNGLPLNLVNVHKSFGERHIIKGIHLDIRAGEFISVVGRSGCGKSTLLRLLAQLEDSDEGQIISDSLSTQARKEHTRLMFQDARLLPWKTVLQNVGLGLNGQWQARAQKALADVGLAERANDWPSTLSGGQKQRVALARALVHQPKILLLDEPLGALDALTRLEMQQLIVKLWQQYGFTVILVTHDINEAVLTSDRVILIEHGSIDLDESIPLSHPRNQISEIAHLEHKVLSRIMAYRH
jgi:sulfonate transport system ATP-binding protein